MSFVKICQTYARERVCSNFVNGTCPYDIHEYIGFDSDDCRYLLNPCYTKQCKFKHYKLKLLLENNNLCIEHGKFKKKEETNDNFKQKYITTLTTNIHITKELQKANEELQKEKLLNKELQKANEELHEDNEELHEANEELQKAYEELQKAYEELHEDNEELQKEKLLNKELQNIINNYKLNEEFFNQKLEIFDEIVSMVQPISLKRKHDEI
jgi:DNA repair ATPase RecN